MDDFVQSKNNLHTEVKTMATKLRKQMAFVVKEQKRWQEKAEKAEKALEEERARKTLPPLLTATPAGNKRGRAASETSKSPTGVGASARKMPKTGDHNQMSWSKVVGRNNAKKAKADNNTRSQNRLAEKPKPKPKEIVRSKAEALLIEVKEGEKHDDLLRRLKKNDSLKALGEKVVRVRHTQKGDMLIVLQKDPKVKSAAFKEAVENALGDGTKVRALSHVATVQIRNLDEATTAEEISQALTEQFQLGEEVKATNIRLWSSYGGTQTAQLRLQAEDAKKLLDRGKIKVGWTVNAFKLMERAEVQRCYRCMGFGHLAMNCTEEDRSKCCRKCGQEGHKAKSCKGEPKCLLCKGEGNKHETGGRNCPAYKEAATKKRT